MFNIGEIHNTSENTRDGVLIGHKQFKNRNYI